MSISESCDPKYVLQNIEATKGKANKLAYLKDRFEKCTIPTTAPTKRKKGKMSGYNCFVRVSVKKGQPFMSVIKSRAWSQLEQKSKAQWNHLAEEGCPPRLWEQ